MKFSIYLNRRVFVKEWLFLYATYSILTYSVFLQSIIKSKYPKYHYQNLLKGVSGGGGGGGGGGGAGVTGKARWEVVILADSTTDPLSNFQQLVKIK